MSKYSNINTNEKDCTERCRLRNHGTCITSAITKRSITDKQLACYIRSVCNNFTQVLDNEGRNALHMAAACGRKELCHWLVRFMHADVNTRDHECGFTALHRSIFYGQLHVAVALMKLGANGHAMDKDDLQPSDHAMKDRAVNDFNMHSPCQIYVWGINTNYTLGTGNQHSRPQPDLLDHFRKNNVSIKQVAMEKFHSVFISDSGRAWACGHGHGGRLGLDFEQTVLKPQPIKTGTEVVVAASVGRDHTILLMESGSVWTCGLNTYHVLGHNPPPASLLTPRPLHPKVLKALVGPVTGVCAARFHSVFWSDSAVVTCGLHGGQLGHATSPDTTIVLPKQVSGLAHKQCCIMHVAASDGATVICVKKGDIYVLHQYQIRKIASRQLGVVKLAVVGGELNSKLDGKLTDKGGHELQVLALMNTGNLLYWQESVPQLTRCIVPLRRGLVFKEIAMSRANIMLITEDGEAYQAIVKPKNKKKQTISPVKTPIEIVEKDECRQLKLTRLPNIHRAVCIATDPKGRNFAVTQVHPKSDLTDVPLVGESELAQHLATLLEEAHEDDTLHDVVFQIGYRRFAAHRYILALSSEELATMKADVGSGVVDLANVDANVFQQILLFAYTGDSDLLHPGPCAIHVTQGDVIKTAIELCKKFGVTSLLKHLQAFRYEDGMILLRESRQIEQWIPPKLDRKLHSEFYDVKIASNDGATFRAHRCILAARLEYFHSMFAGGWIESEAMSNLSLPLPQTVLREILDFLYLDESPSLIESEDVDYISSVLIVADQMFISRLKEICEVALSGVLSLRNAAYMLQLSSTCHAEQLKHCCMQFICLNLPALLESRTLDVVDTSVLEELSEYYKIMIPAMCKRIITPHSTVPADDDIIAIASTTSVPWQFEEADEEEEVQTTVKFSKSNYTGKPGKKKTPRVRKSSSSEVQRRRYESVSSNSDLDTSTELHSYKLNFEELEEQTQKEWITVDNKTKNVLQSRLKAIVTAPSVLPTQECFTKLVPLSKIIEKDTYPDLILEDANEFPQLSDNFKQQKECGGGGGNTNKRSVNMNSGEVKRSLPIKMSQKQRKKLAAEGISDNNLSKSQSPPTRAWAVLNNTPECSFVDILKQSKFGSPSSEHTQTKVTEAVLTPNFSAIIADELEQRGNLSKMKTKSLQLTQLEDKAMEDLLSFYNASNIFDERITVQRVLTTNIAKPTWITTRRH